jgi:transposase
MSRTGAPIAAASEFVEVSVRASRSEIAAAGREALRAGHDVEDVAGICQVSRRTVERWAAQVRGEMGAVA